MLRKFAAALAVLFLALTGTLAHAQAGPGGNVNNAVGLWGQNTATGLPCVVAPTASGSANCALPTADTSASAVSVGYDPTGLVKNGTVLNDDNFANGYAGWLQLYTPNGATGYGPTGTLTRTTYGIPRLQLRTPNTQAVLGMGIKRMSNELGDGNYLTEFRWAPGYVTADTSRPRSWSWGLDTALADGTRRLYEFRLLNYLEPSGPVQATIQLHHSDGSWVTLCSVAQDSLHIAFNENKALSVYIAFQVDTATGVYKGFRYGNLCAKGSLAATPDTTLEAYSPPVTTLVSFANGLNPLFSILNRSSTSFPTSALSEVMWQRTTYLDAKGNGPPLYASDSNGTGWGTNWLLSYKPLTGSTPVVTPEVQVNPGETACFAVSVDTAVTGSPSSASVAIEFQEALTEFSGISYQAEGSTAGVNVRRYVTVNSTTDPDAVSADWPASNFSAASVYGDKVERCIKVKGHASILRIQATPTFVGGTSPSISLTMMENHGVGLIGGGGSSGGGGAGDASAANQSTQITAANLTNTLLAAPLQAVGSVASGATDSGNPVKTGCVFMLTPPTLTDGQRGDCQMGTRGSTRVELTSSNGTTGATVTSSGGDGASNSLAGLKVYSRAELFNGTTYDRARSAIDALNSIGTGVAPAQLVAQLDDTSPTAITENQFGNLRMSTNRALLTRPYATSAQDWTYAAISGGISNTTNPVTLVAATASVRNYLTACQISSDALGAATELAIRDGAAGTVLTRMKIGTAGLTPTNIEWPTPLKSTVNTLLEVVTLTATVTGGIYVNCQGYTAP